MEHRPRIQRDTGHGWRLLRVSSQFRRELCGRDPGSWIQSTVLAVSWRFLWARRPDVSVPRRHRRRFHVQQSEGSEHDGDGDEQQGRQRRDLSHGGSQAGGDADDILRAMFGTISGSETASPRGMTPVSGSVPNDMDAFDVFASGTAGNTGEENSSADISGARATCD